MVVQPEDNAATRSASLLQQRDGLVTETDDGPAEPGILNRALRLDHADCDVDPTLMNLDLLNSKSSIKRMEKRICVLMDRLACVTREVVDEKQAHREV